ncbi:MAG TPA: hypothetical protein VF043_36670 [Ktedonobacteraceae bacterium]
MTTFIEIGYSLAQEETARAIVEASCKETGDLLIGRLVYEETHEVRLLVQLLHATAFSHALQQRGITSYRVVIGDLVHLVFDSSVDPRGPMRDFPLGPDEVWFLAIHDPHQAYICIHNPIMAAKQAAWLLEHEVAWAYVDTQKYSRGQGE